MPRSMTGSFRSPPFIANEQPFRTLLLGGFPCLHGVSSFWDLVVLKTLMRRVRASLVSQLVRLLWVFDRILISRSVLEERSVFVRERRNGLCMTNPLISICADSRLPKDGPLPFLLSNTLVTLPFLFACALVFSLICYWAIGLHSGGVHFFKFLAYLFLALYGAS